MQVPWQHCVSVHTPPVHNMFAAFDTNALFPAVQVAEMELQYTAARKIEEEKKRCRIKPFSANVQTN